MTRDGAFYTPTLKYENAADATKRPWYVGAASSPGKAFWTAISPLLSGRPGASAGTTFVRNGNLLGVAAIDIEPVRLSIYLAGLELGLDSAAFILDRDGTLVALSDPHEQLAIRASASLRKIGATSHPKLMIENAVIAANGADLKTIAASRLCVAEEASY